MVLAAGALGMSFVLGYLMPASGHADPVSAAQGVGVDEHVGAALPGDIVLTDHTGSRRSIASALSGKAPVLLQLAYYHCETLCDLTLRELAMRLRDLGWHLGDEYQALTVSIDPHDTYLSAGAKRERVLELMHAGSTKAWPFFVTTEDAIARVTRALGYRYVYDARTGQYAHPAVTVVLTPSGKIARYLYGPTINARDLSLALREARAGRGGPSAIVDRTILACFHYDPSTRRYAPLINGVLRGGSLLVAFTLATGVYALGRRGRQLRRIS
jgi:protein SCO1/2